MTFVFSILLGGLVAAGIPVLLHLIVRQKPKRLPFPAFRFLVQQQRRNLRKLRLRHLLLMALRVFLIVAMCMLLARPRLFHRVLGLDSERPVNAVLVFDTSASMEYRSSDGLTRLDDARQKARDLVDELPAGSKVAIVDSADARIDKAVEWVSLNDARQRIGNLRIRPANAPVTQALLKALSRFEQADPEKDARTGPARLRLVAVFSDRTKASWDGSQLPTLVDKLDRVEPVYEGLLEARGQIGSLQEMLRGLREQVPPSPGKDYSEQSLLDALAAVQAELTGLQPDTERWPDNLRPALRLARRLTREMRMQLATDDPAPIEAETAQAFRAKVRAALGEFLRATGGAQMWYFDVGMPSPVDLAVTHLELPRIGPGQEQQVFNDGQPFPLQVIVQATGKDQPATVTCQVESARAEFKINEIKAGQHEVVTFQIGEAPLLLKPGDNSIEVRIDSARDPLPLNHRRFATVRVRPKRKVLMLVDEPERRGRFADALSALGYAPEVKKVVDVTKEELSGCTAVYLLGVAAPDQATWESLAGYVRKGGGLGIVPGSDLQKQAYNQDAAQKLMPGEIKDKIDAPLPGREWNWEPPSAKYAHSFMRQFKTWRENPKADIVVYRRYAHHYWEVRPQPGAALVLVEYDDGPRKPKAPGRPAVLDRIFDAKAGMTGKVLLFTTPLDAQDPLWHNYLGDETAFYLELVMQATGYLTGEGVPPQLQFTLGRGDPVVSLSGTPALAASVTVRGPDAPISPLNVEPGASQVVVRDLPSPGNFLIEGKFKDTGELRRLAGFSLNMPSEEFDLTQVPAAEIEPLFVGEALVTKLRDGTLHDALRVFRNEPLDLVPYLMLGLLLALAVENLLANKFYRQPEAV